MHRVKTIFLFTFRLWTNHRPRSEISESERSEDKPQTKAHPDTINRETMALLASSFAGAAVRALSTRSTTRVDRSKGLVCRAQDKMARTTIDLDKRKIGPGTGKPIKVTFLGANGQNVVVDCPEDQYILDAGIDAGLELPFTCRGGICGACVAKCTKGSVDHRDIADLEFTLSEEEQEEGMALLCMCYPVEASEGEGIEIETQSDWGYSLGVAEWKGATGEIGGRSPTPLMKGDLKGL